MRGSPVVDRCGESLCLWVLASRPQGAVKIIAMAGLPQIEGAIQLMGIGFYQ
jgi:hypothetical protein